MTQDTSIAIEPGDEIRRKLPNGHEEAFTVDDPMFYDKSGSFPPHYQVKVSRKGVFAQGAGGHYIKVSGHNARVNIGSVDRSSNFVYDRTNVFKDLHAALEQVASEQERSALREAARRMEDAQGSAGFMASYKDFVSLAANHMTIVAPFIPALSMLL